MTPTYLLSDPSGDIIIDPKGAALPFKITPTQTHPFFTLGDYFLVIEGFVRDHCRDVLKNLSKIDKMVIRSEKHGAFYHISSTEFSSKGRPAKYAVITAVTDRGKERLEDEGRIMTYLNNHTGHPYLPKIYMTDRIQWQQRGESTDLVMVMAEWLEGYDEWHIHPCEEGDGQEVRVWDTVKGHQSASPDESCELFQQAAKILTLYYDTSDYRQIYPWHHGAGDFVVKTESRQTRVKLTTARQYKPVMDLGNRASFNPMIALVYFFLNLTVRMRIDKVDGTGDVIWAGDNWLPPVIKGFLEGIEEKHRLGRYEIGDPSQLIPLLRSFTPKEMETLLRSLEGRYQSDDPNDRTVIHRNLEDHALCLHQVLQRVPE